MYARRRSLLREPRPVLLSRIRTRVLPGLAGNLTPPAWCLLLTVGCYSSISEEPGCPLSADPVTVEPTGRLGPHSGPVAFCTGVSTRAASAYSVAVVPCGGSVDCQSGELGRPLVSSASGDCFGTDEVVSARCESDLDALRSEADATCYGMVPESPPDTPPMRVGQVCRTAFGFSASPLGTRFAVLEARTPEPGRCVVSLNRQRAEFSLSVYPDSRASDTGQTLCFLPAFEQCELSYSLHVGGMVIPTIEVFERERCVDVDP